MEKKSELIFRQSALRGLLLSGAVAGIFGYVAAKDIDTSAVYEITNSSGLVIDNQGNYNSGAKLFIDKKVEGKESQVWQLLPVEGEKDVYCIVSPVSQMAEHYVRAQSMGGRQDTRWLILADNEGHGLRVTADTALGFSALHYTDRDLWGARYGHNLPGIRRDEIVLNLDCAQEGLGNASCGPGPREHYRISKDTDYGYRFRIEPLACR